MKTLATVNAVIFAVIGGLAIGIGLDLKKWYSWLFGAYAFLTFFLVGLGGSGNINNALKAGALATFIIMFGGAVRHWNRESAKKWLQEHEKKGKRTSTKKRAKVF